MKYCQFMMQPEVAAETRRNPTPIQRRADRSMIATAGPTAQAPAPDVSRMSASGVINLQRLAGNAAVGSLLGRSTEEPLSSWADSKSGDVVEDEMADLKAPAVQREDLDPGAKPATDVKIAVASPQRSGIHGRRPA
jgi:hypothetical protein